VRPRRSTVLPFPPVPSNTLDWLLTVNHRSQPARSPFCFRSYSWYSIGLQSSPPGCTYRHATKVWGMSGELLELIALLLYNLIISLEIGFLLPILVVTVGMMISHKRSTRL